MVRNWQSVDRYPFIGTPGKSPAVLCNLPKFFNKFSSQRVHVAAAFVKSSIHKTFAFLHRSLDVSKFLSST